MTTLSHPNRLLALLPEADRRALVAQAELVSLQAYDELYATDDLMESLYFPLTLMVSILVGVGNGKEVELATIGCEGMVGSTIVLGVLQAWGRTLVQVRGLALKLPTAVLLAYMERQPVLRTILTRYQYVLLRQMAQAGACNLLHSMEKRCARWLLTTQDRVGRATFILTQQFLAQMLGVQRATVSLPLRLLKRAGLVTYVRGRLQILDRPGLESIACPCYRLIDADYQRIQANLPRV